MDQSHKMAHQSHISEEDVALIAHARRTVNVPEGMEPERRNLGYPVQQLRASTHCDVPEECPECCREDRA